MATTMSSEPESESGDSDDEMPEEIVYEVPGRPTVVDRRDHSEPVAVGFQCPWCDFTNKSERVVRAHITRASSGSHEGKTGFMPEVNVIAIDEHGEHIGTVRYDESPLDKDSEIEDEELPEDCTPKQAAIYRAVLQQPHLTDGDIAEAAGDILGEDPPTDSYVNKMVNRLLASPTADEEQEVETQADRDYRQLTEKRQRVIDELAKEDDPFKASGRSRTGEVIAEVADVSEATVYAVLKEHPDIIRRKHAQVHAGEAADSEYEQLHARREVARSKQRAVSGRLPTYHPGEDFLVNRMNLREFEVEMATLKESAEMQSDLAATESPMEAHAAGKLEIIERIESFLRDIRSDNEGD